MFQFAGVNKVIPIIMMHFKAYFKLHRLALAATPRRLRAESGWQTQAAAAAIMIVDAPPSPLSWRLKARVRARTAIRSTTVTTPGPVVRRDVQGPAAGANP